MDPSTGWSIIRLVNSGLGSIGVSTGVVGLALGSPVAVAASAAIMVKKYVDSEASKLLAQVQQREGCPHIQLLDGSPPTPAAVEYVHAYKGVAWRFGEGSIYFWHPEVTFKPLVFDWALICGPSGVDLLRSAREYDQKVARPGTGFGCTACRSAGNLRNS